MTLDKLNDADLSRRCRQGEAAAWRELIRRFSPLVYRLSLRVLRQPADAEDASQEVFVKVHRAFDSFDPTRPLKPWIARITYNTCLRRLDQVQRTRFRETEGLDQAASSTDDPERAALRSEAQATVQQALDQLSAQDRALLMLRYREGLTDVELAEATDMKLGTVKTRVFRARGLLRRLLNPLFGEVPT